MATTALYAVTDHSAGRANRKATTTDSHTAATGVPVRGEVRRHQPLPGRAPSRENANTMREAAAVSALPQNNWATITTSSRAFAPPVPRASRKICAGGTPVEVPTVPA